MFKPFLVETPGAAIDTRHGKQSATVRKIATFDIIAQKATIGKIKTVVFEICETVPRKARFWNKICSRMTNGSPFACRYRTELTPCVLE